MIERVIEDWLDNANERSFQIPFTWSLIAKGYTILHLTRHCGMEQGKDILAVSPENEVCAYQLKGAGNSKISLRQWQKELNGQLTQLVFTPVIHPSISGRNSQHHKSFLVTNGEIQEEVFSAINDFNNDWQLKGQGQYRINTVVRGQMLNDFLAIREVFLVPDLKNLKSVLELLLEDGKGFLQKEKHAQVLHAYLEQEVKSKKSEIKRRILNLAVLNCLLLSKYQNGNNHISIIEGWVIFIQEISWFCSNHNLPMDQFGSEFSLARQIINQSLQDLWEEVKDEESFIPENPLIGSFVYKARVTVILGFVSYYGFLKMVGEINDEVDIDKILERTLVMKDNVKLWGESAIPFLLSFYWFLKLKRTGDAPIVVIYKLLRLILSSRNRKSKSFNNPYKDIESALTDNFEGKKVSNSWNEYYYLESLIHLFVRANYKQKMIGIWSEITHHRFKEFKLEKESDFFLWRAEDGFEKSINPVLKKEWEVLREESNECEGIGLPKILKDNFNIFPLVLMVYPHRVSSGFVRWFEAKLEG